MYRVWLGVSLAISVLTPAIGYSAVNDNMLDTLVVTGTRSERRLLDVPVRTEVISRSDIQKSHARDLAEALRHQPGLLLKDIHGKSGSELWLQGLDADRVLVLINGHPVSASTGSTVDLSQISTVDVERIEIVKGAVSALYGSAAMGGVVNVILREPEEEFDAHFQVDIGSYGDKSVDGKSGIDRRNISAGTSVLKSRYKASLSLNYRDTDGFDLDPSTFTFEGDRGSKLNAIVNVGAKVSELSDVSYSLSWYEEDIDRDFSTFAPGQGDVNKLDIETATRLNNTISWEKRFTSGIRLEGYLLNERFEDITSQDVVLTPEVDQLRIANLDTWKGELQFDIGVGDNHNITLGAVLFDSQLKQQQEQVNGSQTILINEITPGASHQSFDVFAQDSIFVGENWEIIPGIRFQEDSDFGSHVAPKVNLLFIPDFAAKLNPRIRLGIGTGYRVPNLKERFFLFDHSANGYVVLGNPDLQPESSQSVQLGFESSLNEKSRVEISLYYNDFKDLISTAIDQEASDQQQLQVFRYSNIAAARTQGFDLNLNHRLSDQIAYNAAYTWLDSKDKDTGLTLTRRPEHQVVAGIDFKPRHSNTEFTVKAVWQSSEFVDQENEISSPAYTTVDLKLNHAVSEHAKWFVGVNNVLDEHMNPANAGEDFRPSSGRFVYAGFRYSL